MNGQYIYEKVKTLVLNLENENTISYQAGRFQTQCLGGCGETGTLMLCCGSINRAIWQYQANVKMHTLFRPRFQLPLNVVQTTQTNQKFLLPLLLTSDIQHH